jgi:hypothetical protein
MTRSIRFSSCISMVLAGIVGGAPGLELRARADEFNSEAAQTAAEKGDAKAEYELARHYASGNGVAKDPIKAADYMRRAADQGFAYAKTDLGSFYARGIGVKKDLHEAFQWYGKAARDGDALGQYCLGFCYVNGSGVATNVDEGIQWWRKSAESGQAEAQDALGKLCMNRGPVNDTNHINYAEAAKWLHKAADQDFVPAMNNLGVLYQMGWGVDKNLEEAVRWYRTAAEKGEPKAQANLGLMYQDGSGVGADLVQAYKWFLLSAEQHDVVGKHYFEDYNLHHRVTAEQMAQAQKMAAEFRARLVKNKFARAN